MKEKRHYTNQERHKIYTAPKVKLKNVPAAPKQKSSEAIRKRRNIIHSYMSRLDERYFCNSIGDYVYIIRKSMKETKEHAAKDYKGTLLAINIDSLFRNAVKIRELKPNSRNQNEFKKMHLLICPVKGVGYAKIVVGELYVPYPVGKTFIHYCVTHTSLKDIKK